MAAGDSDRSTTGRTTTGRTTAGWTTAGWTTAERPDGNHAAPPVGDTAAPPDGAIATTPDGAIAKARRLSFWLDEALAEGGDVAAPLRGAENCDICIVGGGYTGLWTAIRLKEHSPGLDVALIERDICGAGASGRNGACAFPWWVLYPRLRDLVGGDEAVRLARASEDAVAEIGRFCSRHGIDAHYHAGDWIWSAVNEAQIGAWRPTQRALEEIGVDAISELSGGEAARLTASQHHIAGALVRGTATLQPALLARGLRRVALELGVRLFEKTPLVKLPRRRRPLVVTPEGSIGADKVILAINAWSVKFPELRRRLLVASSDMIATAPIPGRLRQMGWRPGLEISDSSMLLDYYHARPDGRVVFGRGGLALAYGRHVGTRFDGPSPRADAVARRFRQFYPGLADVALSHSWSGPIDRTRSGLPFFASLAGRRDILFGAGYSGNGIAPALLGGRILAALALERDCEWANCGLVGSREKSFSAEPLRYVGGTIVRHAVARKEAREDAGRRPGFITRRLAGLVPRTTVGGPRMTRRQRS